MQNLLVELQTEELPPKALYKLMQAFADGIFNELSHAGFTTGNSRAVAYGSP